MESHAAHSGRSERVTVESSATCRTRVRRFAPECDSPHGSSHDADGTAIAPAVTPAPENAIVGTKDDLAAPEQTALPASHHTRPMTPRF